MKTVNQAALSIGPPALFGAGCILEAVAHFQKEQAMPLYEYECQACHRRTEKIQKFSDAELTVCPHCGGALERTVTAPAFQFAGGGWYKDLYSSSKPAESAGSGDGGGNGNKSGGNQSEGKGDSGGGASAGGDSSASAATPAASAPAAPAAAPSSAPAASKTQA